MVVVVGFRGGCVSEGWVDSREGREFRETERSGGCSHVMRPTEEPSQGTCLAMWRALAAGPGPQLLRHGIYLPRTTGELRRLLEQEVDQQMWCR
jgi:hypothetical protein